MIVNSGYYPPATPLQNSKIWIGATNLNASNPHTYNRWTKKHRIAAFDYGRSVNIRVIEATGEDEDYLLRLAIIAICNLREYPE